MQALPILVEGKQAQRAAEFNAATMEAEARIARAQGGAREEQQRRRAREFLGTQRAAAGQAGVGLGGSIADVLGDSAAEAELDALNIRYESNLQALGMENQAAITRWQGKELKRQARAKAVASIISGSSDYAKTAGSIFAKKPGGGAGFGGSPSSQNFSMNTTGGYGRSIG